MIIDTVYWFNLEGDVQQEEFSEVKYSKQFVEEMDIGLFPIYTCTILDGYHRWYSAQRSSVQRYVVYSNIHDQGKIPKEIRMMHLLKG